MKTTTFFRNLTATVVCAALVASCSKESLPVNPTDNPSLKQGAPVAVAILASGNTVGNTNTGSFVASGAFSAVGTWVETYTYNGNKVHSKIEFTDGTSSFELHTKSTLSFSNATNATGSGTWEVKKCTGTYSGMDGSGTLTISLTNWDGSQGLISEDLAGNVTL